MKKKDGTLCPCIDYRGLNNITIDKKYLLLLDAAFARRHWLEGAAKFFCGLDRSQEHCLEFGCLAGHTVCPVLSLGPSGSRAEPRPQPWQSPAEHPPEPPAPRSCSGDTSRGCRATPVSLICQRFWYTRDYLSTWPGSLRLSDCWTINLDSEWSFRVFAYSLCGFPSRWPRTKFWFHWGKFAFESRFGL